MFWNKYTKNMYTPINLGFTIQKWGIREYTFHGHVFLTLSFQTNTSIEVLNLEGNAIDAEGAICLTKVLKENFFITELVRYTSL